MKKAIVLSLSLLVFNAQAMVAPWYFTNRKIDVAVGALAKQLDTDQTDLRISSIVVNDDEDETITVSAEDLSCSYKIINKKMPAGMAGSPKLIAKQVSTCVAISAKNTANYEQIEAKMSSAAAKGLTISKVTVNGKGKIKIETEN